MPWIRNEFIYTKRLLKAMAENYQSIYEAIEAKVWTETLDGERIQKAEYIIDPFLLVEYKVDFDMALNSIGRGCWDGEVKEFKYYRNFGRLQRIVIATISGIEDWELEEMGFRNISRGRGLAYKWMANQLNGIPLRGSQTRFVAKST